MRCVLLILGAVVSFSLAAPTDQQGNDNVALDQLWETLEHIRRELDDQPLCDPGTFGEDGKAPCNPCPLGTSQPVAGSTECTPCPPGEHSDMAGAVTCKKCPAGWFNQLAGATTCSPCPLGHYVPVEGAVECHRCSQGTYLDHEGGTVCTDCDAGLYTDILGADQCIPCPDGFYLDLVGGTSCIPCPGGHYSGQGSTACTACAADTYALEQSTNCTPCPPGTTSHPGALECSVEEPEGGVNGSSDARCRLQACWETFHHKVAPGTEHSICVHEVDDLQTCLQSALESADTCTCSQAEYAGAIRARKTDDLLLKYCTPSHSVCQDDQVQRCAERFQNLKTFLNAGSDISEDIDEAVRCLRRIQAKGNSLDGCPAADQWILQSEPEFIKLYILALVGGCDMADAGLGCGQPQQFCSEDPMEAASTYVDCTMNQLPKGDECRPFKRGQDVLVRHFSKELINVCDVMKEVKEVKGDVCAHNVDAIAQELDSFVNWGKP